MKMSAVAEPLLKHNRAAGDSAPYWGCFQLN